MIKKLLQLKNTLGFLNKMPYYAVARGRVIGIFEEWHMCDTSVKAFKGARYKKFPTRQLAEEFLKEHGVNVSKVCPATDSESESSSSQPINANFWPEEEDNCSSGDDELLLQVSAEVEGDGIPNQQMTVLGKRKFKETSSNSLKNKILKHESIIWEPVGIKKFGKFNFPIDSEGYVICYTDGSCVNNGKSNPMAGLGVYFSENHPLNTAKPVTGRATNNVGEIQASIYAIKIAKEIKIPKLCVSTDSQFLINSITTWIKSWKRNSWRIKTGEPVKNAEDFKELDSLLSNKNLDVKWNYVRGHDGIIGNEMADKLARQGAEMYKKLHGVK